MVQFWTTLYDSETTKLELKQYELQYCISFDKIVSELYRQTTIRSISKSKVGSTHTVLTSAKAHSLCPCHIGVPSLTFSPQLVSCLINAQPLPPHRPAADDDEMGSCHIVVK